MYFAYVMDSKSNRHAQKSVMDKLAGPDKFVGMIYCRYLQQLFNHKEPLAF